MEAARLRIIDGNFDSIETNILAGARRQWKRANEYATVALRADLEIECELEIVPHILVY